MSLQITGSIVTFKNNPEIVKKAIESFINTQLNIRLLIIDNSPTDELKSLQYDHRIKYFHNPSNPGFGAGHNIAIKKAIEVCSKYHLVLNPDVYFEKETLEKILQFMDQHQEVGNLMPNVQYPNGQLQYLCKLLPTPYDWIGRRFNPIKSLVEKRNQLFELRFTGYKSVMEVPYLSGCFMFLNLNSVQQVGLFDERIFMYGEEADLCRRLIDGGHKTVFYPEATIFHHFEKGSHKSLRLTWIGIKSACYYFNKWGWFFDRGRDKINIETLKNLGCNV